jgi:phosphohistidine phosphatase
MKLLFIRHSIALERQEWEGDDLDRPLSEKGKKVANEFFSKIAKIYDDIEVIISSKAKRAKESAEILNTYFKVKLIEDSKLNPSATFEDFIRIKEKIENKFDNIKVIVFVGHEPDFSQIISKLVSSGVVNIKLSKPCVVEIEFNDNHGELRSFLTPKNLKKWRN